MRWPARIPLRFPIRLPIVQPNTAGIGVDPPVVPPVITGDAYPGSTLTSTKEAQWFLNSEGIPGEKGSTLVVPPSVLPGDIIYQSGSNKVEVTVIPMACRLHIDTTKPGSASDRFVLSASASKYSIYNARIYWGDRTYSDITAYNDSDLTHIYPEAGEYDIQITGAFPGIHFANDGDKLKLIRVDNLGNLNWDSNQSSAFYGCANLVSFVTSDEWAWANVTILNETWRGCSSLAEFTALYLPGAQYVQNAWQGCSSLTEFPAIDLFEVESATSAWQGCSSLTTFPLIDIAKVTDLSDAWNGCSSLTSFPALTLNACTNVTGAWRDIGELSSFATRQLNTLSNGTDAFSGTTLSVEDYSSLLISLSENNNRTGVTFHGGDSKYDASAVSARSELELRDWTIHDGGMVDED